MEAGLTHRVWTIGELLGRVADSLALDVWDTPKLPLDFPQRALRGPPWQAGFSICDLLVLCTPSVRVHCRKERQSHPEQESENKARTRLRVLLPPLPYLHPSLSYHLAAARRSRRA